VSDQKYVDLLARSGVAGEMIGPRHADYDLRRCVWNGLIDRRPAAIVRASSSDDVSRTVAVAADAGVPLAVRGGGHSFPGHSTCDDGIVVDLALLNEVVIDETGELCRVGGGALLADLDSATQSSGRVVPAGVVSHTGVGGLTLGGGMGWNSRRFGLTIDNLQRIHVVMADGRPCIVDEHNEPDLFWAMRGGGGNFGVATQFEYRVRPFGTSAVAVLEYPAASAGEVLEDYAEHAANAPRDLTTGFSFRRDVLSLKVLWFGSPDRADSALSPFSRLAGAARSAKRLTTFWDLQTASDDAVPWGRRYYAKGGFLDRLDESTVRWLATSLSRAPTDDCDVYVIQLGGAVTDVGDDATAYTGRSAAFYWVVNGVWDDSGDDEACLEWGRETAQGLSDASIVGNYINEQSDATPDVARTSYGAATYERLVAVKQRYDPANVFRLNQNIRAQPLPG